MLWCHFFAGINRHLDIKMGYEIHALMRDADDIDSIPGDCIEDRVHAFRKTIVAGFYLRTLFPELRIFDNHVNRESSDRIYLSACSTPHSRGCCIKY